MANFFDKFPLIRYTADKGLLSEFDTVRNLLFRVSIIKEVLDKNINSYYFHTIRDSERPEILAEKVYGDSEAHWVILYANNIYDPYYDWPMDSRTFDAFIIKKYGSIQFAKTNIHHYEKVITRENPLAQVVSTTRFEINEKTLTDGILELFNASIDFVSGEIVFVGPSNVSNVFSGEVLSWSNSNNQIVLANTSGAVKPFDYLNGVTSSANAAVVEIVSPSVPFDAYNSLVDTTDFSTYTVGGRTVQETISREQVTYYDYEERQNESKRLIRIIKPEFYRQILDEFDDITNQRVFLRSPR